MKTYIRNIVAIVGLAVAISHLMPALEKKSSIDPTAASINKIADGMEAANNRRLAEMAESDRKLAALRANQ